ncbi:kelch repeat-containing protein, partial [Gemmatimonas sp.]|uniref:Kelch repeat-containing protein n=1 Tax=Gemmatimonas sp. TaxID=1962908 RepID=UPI00286A032B
MSHETRRRYAVTMAAFALTSSHALPPGHPSVGRAVATAAGSVVTTSAMRVERAAHTATALRDGRVLVAGGFTNEENAVSGAELFDPAGWRFAALPRMRTLRHSHTATLLPDGKVLLVGGYTASSTVLAAAELFDPATNRFVPTGSLGAARAGHVAVALPNGKVLIAGGVGPAWSFLSSAEIYNPATGRFTPTGSMTIARESHAAVLLQSGHVLVVGGHQGRRADITLFTSAERYDVVSGTFRKVGDMRVRRHKHDAVVLRDGRVLITGGTDERDSDG